ncbi:hypothetical protein [Actimicrobium sp. CCI2.3]|uniref:hypothetical protein n=1 Tax=Actimicrobium sp. CCI2.3 TaxID=3048616 RepID=UPI002AB59EA6|nr:hypothetical protein [Actimicrobium sp. CCI2.3]MDY7576694.1 hypothetical protein [Actimicrobium sp. CCI2.3]MEB0023568.1 hypothetical protein [Actimicrobium sp. CCI2.3]
MTTARILPSTVVMTARPANAMLPNLPADHILGPVQDDWEAAEVWLRAVRAKSRNANAAANTEATYRHHLAKLRWYVEQVRGVTPSCWSMQEVDHFTAFLAQVPENAIGGRGHAPDEAGWRPFRCQPSMGSEADLRRFVHALFTAWHKMGYLRHNPMALHDAGVVRSVNVSRALRPELVEIVIDQLTQEPTENFTQRQSAVRVTFILPALRGLGLRASELIQARMDAFYPLSVPATGKTGWVFHVTAATGKGGKARRIPVPQDVWSALTRYRPGVRLAGDAGSGRVRQSNFIDAHARGCPRRESD